MNEEELLKLLKNEEFMKSIMKSYIQEEFYITNKKPFYSLVDCLKNIDETILESIYVNYKYLMETNKELKSNPSHNEMIKILENEIKEAFILFLDTIEKEDVEILNEISKNRKTEKKNFDLLSNGFMYGFKENQKDIYVIPNELMILYKDYINSDLKKERDYNLAQLYITGYILMNGIIPKSFIEDVLINEYALSISKQQLEEIASKMSISYKNNYYSLISPENKEIETIVDDLLEQKEKRSFIKLEQYQLDEYLEMINTLYDKIRKSLKKESLIAEISSKCFFTYRPSEEIVKDLGLTKNECKKLTKIIENHQEDFRYWIINGRTIEEFEREYFIENKLKKIPQKTNLQSCLKAIPKDIYDEIKGQYEETKDIDLVNQIIEKAKEEFQNCNWIELNEILYSNNDELTEIITTEHLKHGMIFLYEENKKTKYLIPDEILEILKENSEEETYNYEEEIISIYINMNGVIENKKLQELLYEYHDIEIKIKELDDIVKDCGAIIVDKKYYTWVADLTKEDAIKLLEVKSRFSQYKKADVEQDDHEEDFKVKLKDVLSNEISFYSKIEEIYSYIISVIKYGVFNEESLNYIFDEFEISIKEKQKKKIIDLYKEYKNYISIWIYNGYSINEYHNMKPKKTKIGRNDLCPCGSGKKYKKCCGK